MTDLRRVTLVLGVLLLGCGRSDLTEAFPTTEDVTTAGTAGTVGGSSSVGTAGVSGGGAAGRVGQGTGAGAAPGTAGVRGGSAGRTGAAAAGVAGTTGRAGDGGSAGRTGAAGTGVPTTGIAGIGGAAGAPGMGLPCGGQTCAAGQTCCVQSVGGVRVDTCIGPNEACVGGGNVGCVAGTCAEGRICCLSLVGMSSACATPAQCMDGVSTVLCASNADCPSDRAFCCPAIGINICRNYRCPRANNN